MLLKFFNRGTGKGQTAVEYLLKETDTNGIKREPQPELLAGDPQQVINLIDSLDFKHKYNSGVISFAPTDNPTPAEQQAIIDSFEQTAFAGLQTDQYSILWIKHCHTNSNRVELHFITPRVELTTGKSLNIAPPGWDNYFRPWRDECNESHQWASPDDPNRARTYHPGYHALIDAQNLRLSESGQPIQTREDYRKVITNYLGENIKLGHINNREDIIQTLKQTGFEITRTGQDYLTVYREDIGQKVRLKGGIYSASWRLGERLTTETSSRQSEDRTDSQSRIRQTQTELAARIQQRTQYHHSRYTTAETEDRDSTQVVSPPTRTNSYEPLSRFLHRQLGDDSLLSQPTPTDTDSTERSEPIEPEDLGDRTVPNRPREIHHPPTQERIPNRLEVQEQTLLKALDNEDEPTRTRTTANLIQLCHSIRTGQTTTKRTNRQLTDTNSILTTINQQLEQQSRTIAECLSRHQQHLTRLKMKREQELERFKTEINLVEYAQHQGYQLDKNKTSQNCIVLKDNAGDKILIGRHIADDHYFYYSVRDDRDSGSIIDFVQKRKNFNLGEVRKELRPWINNSYSPTSRTANESIPQPKPVTRDRHKTLVEFESFSESAYHPYLKTRGISQQTATAKRFERTIYSDRRNNAIFPHLDREGVCGYEIRNQDFKGFSSGGTKGLWCSRSFPSDSRLVICESPIDCLSYHQIYPNDKTRYLATGGSISELQKDLLKGAFEKIHAQGGEIILAVDRDDAGDKLTLELLKIAPEGARISLAIPQDLKDWNEVLKAKIVEHRQQQIQPSQSRGMELGM
ncbi:toprim domain-containing protein [Merismopedia glauca]|uniref:Relaxase n=1 Tax=Merismopedia glauca CCAP 1448/3 TaxID=1296344 RepID=A0A2T1BY92_9CYAN|nr:toprim domain-containing protein [Merismopedia glauca]PSB00914.1 relaxase [Merismopedia glauca CCAP 1448/3]